MRGDGAVRSVSTILRSHYADSQPPVTGASSDCTVKLEEASTAQEHSRSDREACAATCLSWKQRSAPTTRRAAAPAGPGATRSHRPSRNCLRASSDGGIVPFPPWRLSRSSIDSARSCPSPRRPPMSPARPLHAALPREVVTPPRRSPALAANADVSRGVHSVC